MIKPVLTAWHWVKRQWSKPGFQQTHGFAERALRAPRMKHSVQADTRGEGVFSGPWNPSSLFERIIVKWTIEDRCFVRGLPLEVHIYMTVLLQEQGFKSSDFTTDSFHLFLSTIYFLWGLFFTSVRWNNTYLMGLF